MTEPHSFPDGEGGSIVGRDLMYSKFGPVGACIYCRATDKLSNEHVIPFSLDGNIELVSASCPGCAKETARFEGTVARTIFGNIRMRYGFPTRRPKERPTTAALAVDRNGVVETVDVPVDQHPAFTPVVRFPICGILDGYFGPERPALIRVVGNPGVTPTDLGADAFRVDLKPSVPEFRRLLAKIAHCYTVLNLGLDGFEPWLLPFIRRGSGNPDSFIGTDTLDQITTARPDRRNVHQMLLRVYKTHTHGPVCVVHIALFANWFADDAPERMPGHHVVVGRATSRSYERLQGGQFYPLITQRVARPG
jgi:hypothetical protein